MLSERKHYSDAKGFISHVHNNYRSENKYQIKTTYTSKKNVESNINFKKD